MFFRCNIQSLFIRQRISKAYTPHSGNHKRYWCVCQIVIDVTLYTIPFCSLVLPYLACVGYGVLLSKRFYVCVFFTMFRMIRRTETSVCFRFICHLFTFSIRNIYREEKLEFMQFNYLFGSRSNMERKKSDMKNDQLIHGLFFFSLSISRHYVSLYVWENWVKERRKKKMKCYD